MNPRILRRVLVLVILFALAASPSVSRIKAQTLDIDAAVSELEPDIERALIEGKISSATIALVAGDRVVWTKGYGHSNIWARTPAVPSTVYLIGSTFKAMSTVALLQLMEQGKFKLDDRVSDYLDEFKIQNEDPSNPVTFRHLLTHTSGLPADFGPHPVWGDTVPPSLEEYLKTSLKVSGPPMNKVVYSNMAYTLIGYLVQKLSGVPYKKYIREHIFTPLEMSSTDFEPNPGMEERLAVPYTIEASSGSLLPAVRLKATVWPAGIVYGTALDQANWLIMNLNGGVFKGKRVIGEQTLEEMHTRQYDKFKGPVEGLWGNETAGFGLTWWVAERNGDRYFAHSGSVPGYTAFLLGNKDKKLGFAILTNGHRAHPHLIKLADRGIDLLKAHTKAP
ncbi:MAG: beta-lactamase family protein [Blastocatellia bacterium]|nr:beta-lactamase family protein [Blastocatellia bacterium]